MYGCTYRHTWDTHTRYLHVDTVTCGYPPRPLDTLAPPVKTFEPQHPSVHPHPDLYRHPCPQYTNTTFLLKTGPQTLTPDLLTPPRRHEDRLRGGRVGRTPVEGPVGGNGLHGSKLRGRTRPYRSSFVLQNLRVVFLL